jgi:uncharacterized membrane protein YozB (DUF420 family)
VSLYKNAFYWFVGLLVLLFIGFWKSYFSVLGDVSHVTHHFHAISMLLWIILLITQSWLIRNRRNAQHRSIGKLSFVIAPAVVITGVMVTIYSQAHAEEPLAAFSQSILWFGFFSSGLFAIMYGLAIFNRKNMQLHARYMVATSLVFIVPGLSRAVAQYIGPTGIWIPDFYQITWVPFLIGLWLMSLDWRHGQTIRPFLVLNVLWAINLVLWLVLPIWNWWGTFSAWTASSFWLTS